MADFGPEAREWEEVRLAAVRAVIAAADDSGDGNLVMGDAVKMAENVLAVCDEEAVNRMADVFVNETRVRGMDFRNGVSMDLVQSETLVANWVAAARAWFDHHEAPNYTESLAESGDQHSMEVKLAGDVERYAFILQRVGPGRLTPHEARRKAEAERDEAVAEVARLRDALADHQCEVALREAGYDC
jgi:hypothetical protein